MRRAAALAIALALAGAGGVRAQGSPDDHAAHHPPGGAAAAAPPAGPAGGVGAEPHMAGPARPFLSGLLALPEATPETRRRMAEEADRWIGWGAQAIAAAQRRLEEALARGDPAAARAAAEALREGLAHVEGGVSTLQAVAAGTPPRDFAMAWFRREMSLPGAPVHGGAPAGGLSWYHAIAMAALLALAAALLALQAVRLRRAAALVREAAAAPGPAPAGPAPPPPATPAAPEPRDAAAPVPARAALWRGRLRVAGVFAETPDVKTFRLVPAGGGPVPFAFSPGQFLTVTVEEGGRRVGRSYTIASPPTRSAYVELTVKREAQGAVSRHLHDRVGPGDELEVAGPAGAFTFGGEDPGGIVLIAGGVGITPMMSIVRTLTDLCWPGEIHLIYGARSTRDFVFRDELEHLQRRHANLQVVATMRRAEGTAWMGPEGVVTRELIERSVPGIARRRVHLCGPPPMMEAVRAALAELGVPAGAVRTEAFGPARGQEATPPVPKDAPAGGPEAAAAPVPTVSFARSGRSAPLPPGRTVLEAAEAAGVAIDFSCRVGVCGTCAVPLRSGAVTMEVEDGLAPEDKARGLVLACQAKSAGDLVVEA